MALSIEEAKVSKAVSLILSLAKERKQDDMFSGELPVQMQIIVKKIPKDYNKTNLCLKLPHSLRKPNDDICLFVKDVDKTERDTEPTVDFYKDIFSKKGVDDIKEIVPVKGLKTDFKPYEAKSNLSNAYDIYLADERIVASLPRLLGKSFYGRKKIPTQINVRARDLKGEISNALCKSKVDISVKGTSSMALVGHSGMSEGDLTANVMAAVDQMSSAMPGSCDNISQLCIKARSCTSVPIYMSAQGAPQDIKFKKPAKKRMKVEIDELSTMNNGQVAVFPDGRVLVLKNGLTLKEAMKKEAAKLPMKRKLAAKGKGATVKKAKKSSGPVKKSAGKKTVTPKRKTPQKSKKIKT